MHVIFPNDTDRKRVEEKSFATKDVNDIVALPHRILQIRMFRNIKCKILILNNVL